MGDLEQSEIEQMTDKEIMQVLSLCLDKDSDCRTCRLWSIDRCVEHLLRGAEGLIERRTAERDAAIVDRRIFAGCDACRHYCNHRRDHQESLLLTCCDCAKKQSCKCSSCRLGRTNWEWFGLQREPEKGGKT